MWRRYKRRRWGIGSAEEMQEAQMGHRRHREDVGRKRGDIGIADEIKRCTDELKRVRKKKECLGMREC